MKMVSRAKNVGAFIFPAREAQVWHGIELAVWVACWGELEGCF